MVVPLGCTDDDPIWSRCALGDREDCTFEDGEEGFRVCTVRERFGDCQPYGGGDTRVSHAGGTRPSGGDAGTGTARADAGAALGTCTATALPFRATDVEYSAALDRVIAVSVGPDALTVFDPTTREAQAVPLPLPAAAVSVAPDGMTAAVAHDAYVSIVDLAQRTITATIPTTTDASDIVLAGNGYAHVFPRTDQWVSLHSVEIATRREVTGTRALLYAGMLARLHPAGTHIYGITNGLSPADVTRFDVSTGPLTGSRDSPYHGDYPMCANVWFSEAGDRLFTGCGSVFRATPGSADDLTYGGTLATSETSTSRYGNLYRWIVHSAANHRVYALTGSSASSPGFASEMPPADQIRVHTDDFLQFERAIDMPCRDTPVGKQRVSGRYVFVDPSGERLYLIGQLPPAAGAAQDWTSAVIAL